MAAFKTRSIPTFHAPKPGVAKAARMPMLKLPTMKTGGTPRMAAPNLPKAAGVPHAAVRSTPYSSRIALAASSSSPGALGMPPAGYRKQRNQQL